MGVYKRFHKGAKTTHDLNGDVWDRIWYFYRSIVSKGGSINLHKVIAHADEKPDASQDPILTCGNSIGDEHAKAIAKDKRVSDDMQQAERSRNDAMMLTRCCRGSWR